MEPKNKKRTFASVTEEPCSCGSLSSQADDPDSPIIYDKKLHEYRIEYPGSRHGIIMIYHCPFCGGAAPESKRDNLFAVVSNSEVDRISKMLEKVKSLDDATQILGPPDQDEPRGFTACSPEKDGKTPTVESFRSLTYKKLSDTAYICIIEHPKDGIRVCLQGKYIGPPVGKNDS